MGLGGHFSAGLRVWPGGMRLRVGGPGAYSCRSEDWCGGAQCGHGTSMEGVGVCALVQGGGVGIAGPRPQPHSPTCLWGLITQQPPP